MVDDVVADCLGRRVQVHDRFLKSVLLVFDLVLNLIHSVFLLLGHPE